jgi:hypothetical protein
MGACELKSRIFYHNITKEIKGKGVWGSCFAVAGACGMQK